MSKPVSHQLDVYGAWVHVARTRGEWALLRRRVRSLDPKPSDSAGATTHVQWTSDKGRTVSHWVVWVDVDAALDAHDMLDTVAHEATHVAAGLLEHIGQAGGDSEALAYLVGWTTAWLWRNVNPAS